MLGQCAMLLTLIVTVQAKMESFIVGGTYAKIQEFPHVAFLSVKFVNFYYGTVYWMCGSSLINQELLLTAAHCISKCGAGSAISITMGSENRDKGFMRSSKSYVIHEFYDRATMNCDIGMIKMSSPVNFNDVINRVAIMQHPPIQETAFVSGWGLVEENTEKSSILLKQVDQKVLPYQNCMNLLGDMPKGAICALSSNPNSYPSQGDSGSVLIVRGYIAIGIVSYKVPTVTASVMVYTDVAHFYKWIIHHSKSLYCHTL